MNTEDAAGILSDMSSEEEFFRNSVPLLVFRVVGCTVVTMLVGFTIIVYVSSGMFHPDCLAQICSEICIFAAYMLILLTTTESFRINKNMCLAISISLQFLFIAASLFLLLEMFCMCQMLVSCFRIVQTTAWNIMITGFFCPTIITIVSGILWSNDYVKRDNCWLNIDSSLLMMTMVPLAVCAFIKCLFILITLCATNLPRSLTESQIKRLRCFRTTRWASAIVSALLYISWSFGIRAYHTNKENLYAAFTVFNILLGVFTLILRISTDEEVREKITQYVLFVFISKNKVRTIVHKNAVPTKIFSQTTHIGNGNMKNGKVVTMQNGNDNIKNGKIINMQNGNGISFHGHN